MADIRIDQISKRMDDPNLTAEIAIVDNTKGDANKTRRISLQNLFKTMGLVANYDINILSAAPSDPPDNSTYNQVYMRRSTSGATQFWVKMQAADGTYSGRSVRLA